MGDEFAVDRRACLNSLAAIIAGSLGTESALASTTSRRGTSTGPSQPSSQDVSAADSTRSLPADEAMMSQLQWTAQHGTHVELGSSYDRSDRDSTHEFAGETLIDILTNTSLSLIDAGWEEFGNPAKTSEGESSGCWRYTFRLSSFALALTPADTYWMATGEHTGEEALVINSKSEGYTPVSLDFDETYRVNLSDFIRVEGPDLEDETEESRRVAISARRDRDLFGIANGRGIVNSLSDCANDGNCSGQGSSDDLKQSFRELVKRRRGSDTLNAARLQALALEREQDRDAAVNLGLAILGIATVLTGGTAGAIAGGVLFAVDLALTIIEFFMNEQEYTTPYYSGFEVETPMSSDRTDAVASHHVAFDVYATPGESTFFTVDSRHNYDLWYDDVVNNTLHLEQGRSGTACAPEWKVSLEPPAVEDASDVEVYGNVRLSAENFERNESQPPQPAISFPNVTPPVDEQDAWNVRTGTEIDVHAYESLLSRTRFISQDISWELQYYNECDLRPAECNNFGEEEGWMTKDTGSGWNWSFTPDEGGQYRISVLVEGEAGSATVSETFEIAATPEPEIVEPAEGWISATVGDPVAFRGDATFSEDGELTSYWNFPAEAKGRDPDEIPPGLVGPGDDPDTITREPEDFGEGVSFTFEEADLFEVTYVVYASNGTSAKTTVDVNVHPAENDTPEYDPTMSPYVQARLDTQSPGSPEVGERVTLDATDSVAQGNRNILGYDWDLSGTGENFIDLSDPESGTLQGALSSEGTIEFPQDGEFTEVGEETVQVMVYAVNPQAPEDERLEAGVAELTIDVQPSEDPMPEITEISQSHPLARQLQKLKPIDDPGYWSQPEVKFFTGFGTEMQSNVDRFEWTFEADGSDPSTVARRTEGVVFHDFESAGAYVVELTAVYESGREATVRRTVSID